MLSIIPKISKILLTLNKSGTRIELKEIFATINYDRLYELKITFNNLNLSGNLR